MMDQEIIPGCPIGDFTVQDQPMNSREAASPVVSIIPMKIAIQKILAALIALTVVRI